LSILASTICVHATSTRNAASTSIPTITRFGRPYTLATRSSTGPPLRLGFQILAALLRAKSGLLVVERVT
jgi:hypothetical protein